ncbi:MAG: class I SAM-dependent methyltransferase [Patescibacteria group bacterium]
MTKKSDKPAWWSEEAGFFGPEYLRQYEGTILSEEKTTQQVEFIRDTLNTRTAWRLGISPLKILDVPCGHGRHCIELALKGDYAVTGYELNQFFIEQAKAAATAAEVRGFDSQTGYGEEDQLQRLRFVHGDMRELPYEEEFHVALNLFTAMGYFEDDREDEKFFNAVFRSLKPGGVFLVDYLNRDRLMRNFSSNDYRRLPDETVVLTERAYDPLKGTMYDFRQILWGGREISSIRSSVRFYAPHELVAMAARSGFSFLEAWGDFDTSCRLTMDSPRAILLFQKPS